MDASKAALGLLISFCLCTYMVLQIGLLIYLACPWTLFFVVNSSNLALHLRYLLCIVISATLYFIFWAMSGFWVDLHSLLHNYMTPKSCSWRLKSAQDLIDQVCCAEEYFRPFWDLTALVTKMKTDADYKLGLRCNHVFSFRMQI